MSVVVFAGALVGFTLAKLMYLDLRMFARAFPGEWYWTRSGRYRVGISLHLGCILPVGLLIVWQFVPAIRHRWLWFHRINGYVVVALIMVSKIGVLLIARRSFGGEPSLQAGFGVLVIATTATLCLAIHNIRRLQLDQHRAWMLRTVFYLGTIVTLVVIMNVGAQIITGIGSYHTIWSCDELQFVLKSRPQYLLHTYPRCASNSTANVIVHSDFSNNVEEIASSLRSAFGIGLWLAIILHGVGVEVYLHLTPRESRRLRQVSYERQLEAGFEHPGSSGLVVEWLGDADQWRPNTLKA